MSFLCSNILVKCYVTAAYKQRNTIQENKLMQISPGNKTPEFLEYKVTIPANTTATLYLTAASAENISESGNILSNAQGVRLRIMENGRAEISIKSGACHFVARI